MAVIRIPVDNTRRQISPFEQAKQRGFSNAGSHQHLVHSRSKVVRARLWDAGRCDCHITCFHYFVTHFHESAQAMSTGQHGINSPASTYTLQLPGDSTLILYVSSVLAVSLLSCAF